MTNAIIKMTPERAIETLEAKIKQSKEKIFMLEAGITALEEAKEILEMSKEDWSDEDE